MNEEKGLIENTKFGKLLVIAGMAFCIISLLISLDGYFPKQSLLFNIGRLKAFWGIPLRYCLTLGVAVSFVGLFIVHVGLSKNMLDAKSRLLSLSDKFIKKDGLDGVSTREGVQNTIWMTCFILASVFSFGTNEDSGDLFVILFSVFSIPIAIFFGLIPALYKNTWLIMLLGIVICKAIVFKSFLYGFGVVTAYLLMSAAIYSVFLLIRRKPRRWFDLLNQLLYIACIFFALSVLNDKVIAPMVKDRLNPGYSSLEHSYTNQSPSSVASVNSPQKTYLDYSNRQIPSMSTVNNPPPSPQKNLPAETIKEYHERLIYEAHPDLKLMSPTQTVAFLDEVLKWAGSQPGLKKRKELLRIYDSGTTNETIWLFTEFKKTQNYKSLIKSVIFSKSETTTGKDETVLEDKDHTAINGLKKEGQTTIPNSYRSNDIIGQKPIDDTRLKPKGIKPEDFTGITREFLSSVSPRALETLQQELITGQPLDYTKIYKTQEEIDAEPFWNKYGKKVSE